MGEFWQLLKWAVLAALTMSPVHALFGLHIVRRGLIFIDLAVAQVAALGVALAIAYGHEAGSRMAHQYSIMFALGGAMLISLTRFRLFRVPHEAIIGVVYVLSTALTILILECAPSGHGLEELRSMLAGNIIFVQQKDVVETAAIYGTILVIMLAMWRQFSSVTLAKEGAEPSKVKAVLLDFVFYSLLGFVVASSVKIAGVLVVFSWLVMPAVVAFFFVERLSMAALIAIPLGMLGSLAGLLLSFYGPALHFGAEHEHGQVEAAGIQGWPDGPSIVISLGSAVVLAYLIRLFIPQRRAEVLEET